MNDMTQTPTKLKTTILRTKKLTEDKLSREVEIVTSSEDCAVKKNITFVRSLLKFLTSKSNSKRNSSEKKDHHFFKKSPAQDSLKIKIDEAEWKFHQIAHHYFIKRMSLHAFYNWKISRFKSISNQLEHIETKRESLHFNHVVENLSKEVEKFEANYDNYSAEEYCRMTRITDYFAK